MGHGIRSSRSARRRTRPAGGQTNRYAQLAAQAARQLYADVELADAARLSTGIGEFDRVLGGGIVPGSLVLLGGEPGIGKSTLLLQAAAHFARAAGPVLYASGEESEHQIKSRGDRLGVGEAPLYLLSETCIERILEEDRPPQAVARRDRLGSNRLLHQVSIRTREHRTGARGGDAISVCCEGPEHSNHSRRTRNEGRQSCRPKVLEHVVDPVLYFEGERHHAHRVVRAVKNRYGAVSELGVFEMTAEGLRPVPNPSKLFLSERASGTPGSAVLCCVEGSRPILVEVQALVSTSTYGNARRMAIGIDQNRVSLLLAVLEKRAGLTLAGDDVYVNIAGGMSIDEPAADLSVVAAVASSVRNRSLAPPRHSSVRSD